MKTSQHLFDANGERMFGHALSKVDIARECLASIEDEHELSREEFETISHWIAEHVDTKHFEAWSLATIENEEYRLDGDVNEDEYLDKIAEINDNFLNSIKVALTPTGWEAR